VAEETTEAAAEAGAANAARPEAVAERIPSRKVEWGKTTNSTNATVAEPMVAEAATDWGAGPLDFSLKKSDIETPPL
jgi:secreted PhoX family phosphatase